MGALSTDDNSNLALICQMYRVWAKKLSKSCGGQKGREREREINWGRERKHGLVIRKRDERELG